MVVNTSALIIVIGYLVGMMVVGFIVGRLKIKGAEDYLLAGRRMGIFMVAFSLSANNIGGGCTTGLAQKAFGSWGMSAMWYVLAASIAMIPLAYFAPKIRKAMAVTIPEVVGRRFGKFSSVFTAVLNILALFCLTSSQVNASGQVVATLTGINPKLCMIIAGVIIILYTTLGGMIADQISDMVQFLIIFLGLAVATPIVIKACGGWSTISASLPAGQTSFTKIGWAYIFGYIFNYFCTFLSGPEMISRFETAKDEKTAKRASLVSGVLMAAMAAFPTLLGLAALAVKDNLVNLIPGGSNAMMAVTQAYAPALITGIISAAIISATMSSADSNLLCMSTMIINDIYKPYYNKNIDGMKEVTTTRICNIVCCVIAMIISFANVPITSMNTFAFGIRCAGPFAAYGLGLIVSKATKNSGFISIITGTVAFIFWQILTIKKVAITNYLMPIVFGCLISVITFYIVNLIEWKKGVPSAPSAYLASEEKN